MCSYNKNELICDYIKYDQHYKRKKKLKILFGTIRANLPKIA